MRGKGTRASAATAVERQGVNNRVRSRSAQLSHGSLLLHLGTVIESHDVCNNGRGNRVQSVNVLPELLTASWCRWQRPRGNIFLEWTLSMSRDSLNVRIQ